jgi:hypothetical protein
MRLRGGQDETNFGATAGYVTQREASCDGVPKMSLFMHPPYQGGTGATFAKVGPITLPTSPAAAFRALVGKADGSDPGDGILYQVTVVQPDGTQVLAGTQTVTEHKWTPIEADLSRWAGQTIVLKLVSDVGLQDNSSGDWACWTEMKIVSLAPLWNRRLEDALEAYRREPAPYPATGVTVSDLRGAVSGWLHYEGCGLSGGNGAHGSNAVVNGVTIGPMEPAGGRETAGLWAKAQVPLTTEAIQTLGLLNAFELDDWGNDWFKVRGFWLELQLADGRRVSSEISSGAYTQPPGWPFGEGVMVPHGQRIKVEVWFKP